MAPSHRQPGEQLDLFSGGVPTSERPSPDSDQRPRLVVEVLDDVALIAALPYAGLSECHALAAEAGRRRLTAAVPALDTLCRRFKGFGLHQAVPEQVAALQGLAEIGGRAAAIAVTRLVSEGIVQGPGLKDAIGAAALLSARLPPDRAASLLRHAEPSIRADACRCAPPVPEVVALLVSLLDDLHVAVADAAACALGRMGRPEAAPALSRLIQVRPTAAAIEAIAPIADGNVIVLLGRIARAQPSLADAVLDALDDIDTPQAAAVATSIRRNNGMERGDGALTTAPVRRFDGPDAQLTEVRIRS